METDQAMNEYANALIMFFIPMLPDIRLYGLLLLEILIAGVVLIGERGRT